MKKSILIAVIFTVFNISLDSQIIAVNYQPGTLGACLTIDTVSVTVTNSTTSTVTNMTLEPTMSGFNYVSLVPVAGVTVTNSSNSAPVFTIASLAPSASIRIRYFIQGVVSQLLLV